MKVIFFSLFLIVCMAEVSGQQLPVIVKDYKLCTVGLQDAAGNWLAPAVYTDIRPFEYKQALAMRNGLYGVLDVTGKERIPARYTQIKRLEGNTAGTYYSWQRFTRYDLYVCKNENATTVIDTTGKIILYVAMDLVSFSPDNIATGVDSAGNWHFVWLNGKIVPLPASIRQEPRRLMNALYAFQNGPWKPHGVIDTAAQIILQPVYERVTAFPPPFSLVRGDIRDTAFYFTIDGKPVAQLKSNRFGLDNNPFQYTGLLALESERGSGVINWKGDTVLPFIYESAPLILGVHNFIVQLNGRFGAVTDSTYQLPVTMYDRLLPVPNYNPGHIPGNHFYTKNEDGWNLLDEKGQPYFPEAQDTFVYSYHQVLFVKGKEITCIRFEWFSCSVGITQQMYDAWKPLVYKEETPRVYYDEDYPVDADTSLDDNYEWYERYEELLEADSIEPYRISRKKPPVNPYPYILRFKGGMFMTQCLLDTADSGLPGYTIYLSPQQEEYQGYAHTQIVGMSMTDSAGQFHFLLPSQDVGNHIALYESSNSALVTAAGKLVVPPGNYIGFGSAQDSSGTILAYDRNRHLVLMDSTGNVQFETHNDLARYVQPGLIWTGDSMPARRCPQPCMVYWKLFNYQAQQFMLDTSLHLTETFRLNNGVQKVKTLRGTGLISSDLRLIAQPVYGEIIEIDKTNRFYVVQTCKGQMGLINSKGEFLLDTIYNGFTRLQGNAVLTHPSGDSLRASDIFLFFNHRDSCALWYGNGTINRIDTSEHALLLDIINKSFLLRTAGNYNCRDCNTTLEYHKGASLRSWQRELMYDHIFDSCRGGRPEINGYRPDFNLCACKRAYLIEPYPYNPNGLVPVTVYRATDSLLVFDNHHQSGEFSSYFVFHNVMLTARGPVTLTLDSLFTGSSWRQIITDSVLSYLAQHPVINTDCSQPGRYPDILKKRFLLNEEGLCLYPDWSRKTDQTPLLYRPCIIIPWSVLEPHLRNGIKRKLGVF